MSLFTNKIPYDINPIINLDNFIIKNIDFADTEANRTLNFHKLNRDSIAETIPNYRIFRGIASNSTGFENNYLSMSFDYNTLLEEQSIESSRTLVILKCGSWNYPAKTCLANWTNISSSTDLNTHTINGNSINLNTYILAENKCGNGGCDSGNFGETIQTCPEDCRPPASNDTGPGPGPGSGGTGTVVNTTNQTNVNINLTNIENILKSLVDLGGVRIQTTSIYKEMFAGETTTVRISLKNTLQINKTISLEADGDIKQFIFFETTEITILPEEERNVLIRIFVPKTIKPGTYDGDIILSSENKTGKISTTIKILSPEGKLLDVKIQPLTPTIAPGKILRLQTDLMNLGQTKKVDVQFDLQLLDISTGNVLTRTEEAFAVETTISTIKNLTIPEDTKPGRYMVKATAYYSNPEQANMQASSIAYITVEYPFLQRKIFGIPFWIYLIAVLILAILVALVVYIRWKQYQKKRFKTSVDITKLPQPTQNSGFIGKVAETGIRAFIDMNKLQMHTLIAGSTGSGKTVAAQGIIEEALLHNKSIIVFDPTAQWTGFLRKTDDRQMFSRYRYFEMKEKDARAFNGTIKTISNPYELINIKNYLNKPGEITIFNVSRLTPKEIDIVVASTIEQIFKSEPEESKELKTLIIYDEVHRLLPKFGGSGSGFIQLERGAREFRKWGIGLVLISQVLSDFIGEIKANIGTEIQMGTRYEGDLERVSMKYGEDILKSVVKEPIGTGMMNNAEYNDGKPYFVSFRPLLHSTKRLSNEELNKYEKYFEEIEDLEYQGSRLEFYGIDILDLKLEIKLARAKIKEGQFQMADMYLEPLVATIQGHWMSLKKNPEHIVRQRISREEIIKGIEKSMQEREKFLRNNPQTNPIEADISNLKKSVLEKKKLGKNTLSIESRITDFENKIKSFKGKIDPKYFGSIKQEIISFKKEIDNI